MKKFLLFLLGLSNSVFAQTTIFSQDFSSSAVVADYVSGTPGIGQFTAINNATNNPTSINSGTLRFAKSGGSTGYFSRITPFTGAPELLEVKFDFEISNNLAAAAITQATFYVGSNFENSASAPATVDFHSRITFNFETTGSFSLRNIGPNTNGNIYTGKRTITLVINNTSSSQDYLAPSGVLESVGIDAYDIWVGNVKEFNDIPATTPTVGLNNMKFIYPSSSSNANLDFDNFVIKNLLGVLPIQLSSFAAQAIDKTILLNWETLSETENASFEIERSVDGISFTKIGSKEGSGTTIALTKYRFVDENPLPGTNYYRLKQLDIDGKSEILAVRSAISNISFATLSVLQNSNTVTAQILSPVKEKAKLSLFDIGGKVLAQQDILLENGLNRFDFSQNLVSGVYFFKLTSASNQINTKFIKL
ncbi:T9SS type A sorting domain-containing protein [Pedobacter glucosidilyticus]|uniref:T9SS type A sorting domain-containing protein n=1 Tax=Pedobacter glucosidilyticus TaxID=1122941 RepID=UPI000415625D|nr:T9SS type A sorting domain-containing protein [Pedobacter glucosidilyticus]